MKIAVPNDPSHKMFNYAWARSTPISARQISMGNCVLNKVVLPNASSGRALPISSTGNSKLNNW